MQFASHSRIGPLISLIISTSVINTTLANDAMREVNNGNIDDRSSGDFRSNAGVEWRLITDNVMGGLSSGQLTLDHYKNKNCLRMRGDVSTENNGGFLQIALSLSDLSQSGNGAFDASAYDGIELEVAGNNESYNIHIRTSGLWLPWQSYRASFTAGGDWQTLRIPFASLQPYKTSRAFSQDKLKRIGLVAIGRGFQANLCLARISFYSE
ncbi:MAG: CIA30 family protein [Gammaproteobacteria bacterium]|nr:CIA30 family protein [Gammaproteobacteria bacterium]